MRSTHPIHEMMGAPGDSVSHDTKNLVGYDGKNVTFLLNYKAFGGVL